MIQNKMITLSQGFVYTDYYCEWIKYKNKKFKILIKSTEARIIAHIFLLNKYGISEIADGSDFEESIRHFDINESTSAETKHKYIRTQVKYAKDFITKIF